MGVAQAEISQTPTALKAVPHIFLNKCFSHLLYAFDQFSESTFFGTSLLSFITVF